MFLERNYFFSSANLFPLKRNIGIVCCGELVILFKERGIAVKMITLHVFWTLFLKE